MDCGSPSGVERVARFAYGGGTRRNRRFQRPIISLHGSRYASFTPSRHLLLPKIYDPFSNACLEAWRGPAVITTPALISDIIKTAAWHVIEGPSHRRSISKALAFCRTPKARTGAADNLALAASSIFRERHANAGDSGSHATRGGFGDSPKHSPETKHLKFARRCRRATRERVRSLSQGARRGVDVCEIVTLIKPRI